MKRTHFLTILGTAPSTIPMLARAGSPQSVAGLPVPDSALAKEAASIAQSSEPPEVFNHSLRTFYFAELLAKARGIDHDVEVVYVASILHDTGLSPQHMTQGELFEVDGANTSRVLLAKHGVDERRIELVWDAISLHDRGGIARWKQPEVALVNAGVSADFGAHLAELQKADIVAVLQAAPRHNFVPVFLAAVANFAKKNPEATGNSFVTDVARRMVPGFHLDNFCDEVADDPFASYRAN